MHGFSAAGLTSRFLWTRQPEPFQSQLYEFFVERDIAGIPVADILQPKRTQCPVELLGRFMCQGFTIRKTDFTGDPQLSFEKLEIFVKAWLQAQQDKLVPPAAQVFDSPEPLREGIAHKSDT